MRAHFALLASTWLLVCSLQAGAQSTMDTTALAASPVWSLTGSLNTPRLGHTATLLPGGKVLVAGGSHTNSAELYDIATGSWSLTGSLTNAYYRHTATLLPNGKVLVVGRIDPDGFSSELYDPATGWWSPDAQPPQAFVESATLLPNGKVLFVWYSENCEDESYNIPPRADLYDPATHAWYPAAAPTSVHNSNSTATLLQNGQVLVVGGNAYPGNCNWWDGYEPTQAEVYDPVSDSWKSVGPAIFVGEHATTLLPNGKVLIAGGQIHSPGPWGAIAKLYDPATESFTDTGDLTTIRDCCHTATLLSDDKVLVVGGTRALSSVELYDPDTGVWTRASSLSAGRWSHTATLLPDGRVLVAGGGTDSASGPVALDSAELYGPAPRADFGLYRKLSPSGAPYYRFLLDFDFDHVPDAKVPFGAAGDVPLVGKIAPGGMSSLIVFRNGFWYIDTDRNGTVDTVATLGMAGDIPLVANFSGPGQLDDLVVYRAGFWFVDTDLDGRADRTYALGGLPGDIPVAGDVNGDGVADLAIYRGGIWYVDTSRDGIADLVLAFGGLPQDIPLLYDWDGDGQADLCLYRDGIWYISTKRDGVADVIFGYGAPGDLPLVGTFW